MSQPQLNLGALPPPPGQQGMYIPPQQTQPQLNLYNLPPPVTQSQPLLTPVVGRTPQFMTCPYCQQNAATVVKYEIGCGTCLCGGLLCLIGGGVGNLILPFFGSPCSLIGLVPCCVDSCKKAVHHCPYCHNKVGEN
eukprot:TRINITY_DN2865_c0_g1_i1.p1 TRINITY_DN2865_c0_g1~~TRINITY_DN2865_c0_g1_i1.p1  ORF type:complete len:136 (+),score=25.63 TRINITY_DN2865_c0_g1_i1:122-529(+)